MYYVLTVENCTPLTYVFSSKKEVKDFLKKFIKKYGSLDDKNDNWVDQVFRGEKLDLQLIVKIGE